MWLDSLPNLMIYYKVVYKEIQKKDLLYFKLYQQNGSEYLKILNKD